MVLRSMRLTLFAATSMVCIEPAIARTTCLHEDSYISFDGGIPPNGALVATSTLPDSSNVATWTTTQVSGASTRPIYRQNSTNNPRIGVLLGGGVQNLEISYVFPVSNRLYRISDLREGFEKYIITGFTATDTPVLPNFQTLLNGAETEEARPNVLFDEDDLPQASATFTFDQPIIRVTFENADAPPFNGSYIVIQELVCAPVSSLKVTKNALSPGFQPGDDLTELPVGAVITYEYKVENTGTVPIRDIQLSDAHDGLGVDPVPGAETLDEDNFDLEDSVDGTTDGSWDVLGPGDIIRFEGTYTVTQSDIDSLQ